MTLGLTRDEKHVYTWDDGKGDRETFASVTTVIGVIDKSGPLVGWAKRITAEAAIDNRAQIEGWVELGGRDGAISFLTKAATAKRDRAANAGTEVHAFAEAIVRGNEVEVPEELAPYVAAYRTFLVEFSPEVLAAEEMVASLKYGYAGTFDLIARISGETWLLDIKTSKGVYGETALQLSAYANADFIGRPGETRKYRLPAIEKYGVIHLRPEGYHLVPYTVTRETFGCFLAAKAINDWRNAPSPVGPAITPALLAFQAPATEGVAA